MTVKNFISRERTTFVNLFSLKMLNICSNDVFVHVYDRPASVNLAAINEFAMFVHANFLFLNVDGNSKKMVLSLKMM